MATGAQPRFLLNGAQVIARAAIEGGVRFFAGYPITPASPLYHEMIRALPKVGGIAIGASDEISALSYCIGASLRGWKAMTATSGPGFALMVESLAYALMTETPLLLVLAQRMGPSTGAATASSQGDLLFAIFSNSGSYPLPVFSPESIHDAYALTIHALNTAERLRTPVILLVDKELMMSTRTVFPEDLEGPPPLSRPLTSGDTPYRSYEIHAPEDIPPFLPVGSHQAQVRVTGSAHDRQGLLQKDDPEVLELLEHLQAKIWNRAEELWIADVEGPEDASWTWVSFGTAAQSARAAFVQAQKQGELVKLVVLKTLWPLAETTLQRILGPTSRVLVIEENPWGHLAWLLSRLVPKERLVSLHRIGRRIDPQEILDVFKSHEAA